MFTSKNLPKTSPHTPENTPNIHPKTLPKPPQNFPQTSQTFPKHFPNNIKIQIAEREPLGIINIDNQLMIDNEGIILPGGSYSENYLIPVLSGFNSAKELYPEGEKTYSIKVKEAVEILKILSLKYPNLYENISELTLNKDDEYVMILDNLPTRVILLKK